MRRSEAAKCISITMGLASWIGIALPHINLAYDMATRELLRCSGIATIHASNGDNVKANIVFDPVRHKKLDRADLDAASAVALGGRCRIP